MTKTGLALTTSAALVFGMACATPRGMAPLEGEGEVSPPEREVDSLPDERQAGAAAQLTRADGEAVGIVEFTPHAEGVNVEVRLSNLDVGPGFRGIHIHENAECDPDHPDGEFMGAGGHWTPGGRPHGDHEGDLPPVLVTADGVALASFLTDRFTVEQLLDAEVAVILHRERDNLAHIPDRYISQEAEEPGPDEETLATGDAGGRAACGVVLRFGTARSGSRLDG